MNPSIYRTIIMITARAISKVALRIIENQTIGSNLSSIISVFENESLVCDRLVYNQFVILNGNLLLHAMSEPKAQQELYDSVSHVSRTLLMALKIGNNEFLDILMESYTKHVIMITSNIQTSCSLIMKYYGITVNNFFGVVHNTNITLEQIIGLFYDCIEETVKQDSVLQKVQEIINISTKWI
jgi:hypothetical protein